MIDTDLPASWRDLQDRVARILSECAVAVEVERHIRTARGEVTVDVWASDPAATPPQSYILECKRWRTRVPQTVVHAFRAVVGDSGANWGAIVSAAGFQRGAYTAAEYSNVRLLTWDEFQALFSERWIDRYFVPTVSARTDALMEYTEPINSRVFRKADALTDSARQQFRHLRDKHAALGVFCLALRAHHIGAVRTIFNLPGITLKLPLRQQFEATFGDADPHLPDDVLDATSYRGLLERLLSRVDAAVAEFDTVFGERA